MNLEFLKEVLSLPSISGDESMVRDYIIEFAKTNDIEYYTDKKGNLYLTKGVLDSTEEYFPCVVSHMDTVHRTHITLIENKERLIIKENDGNLIAFHPSTEIQTGIGGDDKCGVFVCLELFNRVDKLKGAFFVEEEIGMMGSKESDDSFFSNVGYAIQFDAPSSNWITEVCWGVNLFDSDFKEIIKDNLNESGYTKFSYDPFTDVNQLATKYDFNCLNLGCGYYRQHTNQEYVVIGEVESSLIAGEKLISHLGNVKYTHNKKIIKESNDYNYSPFKDDEDDDEYGDYVDYISYEVVDMVSDLIKSGLTKKEIVKEVKNYLEDII
jgi:tripeptide aminopeptidase